VGRPAANITGNLTCGSSRQALIAPEAKIAGATNWEQIQSPPDPERIQRFNWLGPLA
jgi:hypothetical protein